MSKADDEARKARNQSELRRFLDQHLRENPDSQKVGICTGCGRPAVIGGECCVGALVRNPDLRNPHHQHGKE